MAAGDVNSIPGQQIQDAQAQYSVTVAVDSTNVRQSSSKIQNGENGKIDIKKCIALQKAALKGDWETAKCLLEDDPTILCASITKGLETVLHIATGARQIGFVEELVKLMKPEDLTLEDRNGNCAFFFAAAAGDVQIAKIMLKKNGHLLKIRGAHSVTPIFMAALFARRDMTSFLYGKTKGFLMEEDWTMLFFTCINTGLYDLALNLLEDHPELAVARDINKETALHVLARKPSSFAKRNLGVLDRLVNSYKHEILEGVIVVTHKPTILRMKVDHNIDSTSTQSRQLIKCLWEEILEQGDMELTNLTRKPSPFVFDAAKLGNFEFVAELVRSYPDLVYEADENNHTIFHIAILHRHASIFNLIYEIGFTKELMATFEDKDSNNMLHLAAKFPHPSRVSIVSGAALQMQRELLWFKEIEKVVQPSYREKKNSKGETPQDLFIAEHKELLKSGELWMKTTATSCMIVPTLIATVVFGAIFSVPGGNDNNTGIPIHLRDILFQVFAMSDVIALSSSSIAILTFLSILTSRYAQDDFLKSLPLKLMVGLSAVFISIVTMMIAFSTTFFLAYHDRLNYVTIFTIVLAFMPITLFFVLQYPLLRDIFYSTYHSRFLFKPSNPML